MSDEEEKKKEKLKQRYVIKKTIQSSDLESGESAKIAVGAPSMEEVKELFRFASGSR